MAMAMTRRGLFQFFTAAAIAADPEKLLWVPGQKLISIPTPINNIIGIADILQDTIEMVRPKLEEMVRANMQMTKLLQKSYPRVDHISKEMYRAPLLNRTRYKSNYHFKS